LPVVARLVKLSRRIKYLVKLSGGLLVGGSTATVHQEPA
jgi:hypothetical protein